MTARRPPSLPALATLPALLYGTFLAASGLTDLAGPAGLGLLLAAVPLVAVLLVGEAGLAWLVPALGVVAGNLLALNSGFAIDSPGAALFGGLLVGSPLTAAAALLAYERTHPRTMVLFVLLGLVDLVMQAAVRADPASAAGLGGGAYVDAFAEVNARQLEGLQALVGGSSGATLPLQALGEPVLDALLLLALVGAFVALFARAQGDPAPEGSASVRLPPVLIGVGAAAAFELAAVVDPRDALFGLALGMADAAILVIVLAVVRRGPAPVTR